MSWQEDYAAREREMGEAQTGATLEDAVGFFAWLALHALDLLVAIGLLYVAWLGLRALFGGA